jgi:hypothetical protein
LITSIIYDRVPWSPESSGGQYSGSAMDACPQLSQGHGVLGIERIIA